MAAPTSTSNFRTTTTDKVLSAASGLEDYTVRSFEIRRALRDNATKRLEAFQTIDPPLKIVFKWASFLDYNACALVLLSNTTMYRYSKFRWS